MSQEESGDLNLRDASLDDAGALARLMGELGYPTSPAEMRQRLETILPQANFRTFVATMAGEVCGMIGTVVSPSYEHNDRTGRIVALVVSEKARRRGVARRLIGWAEKDFAGRAVTRISLTTRLSRSEAHKFYEQMGYAKTGYRYAKEIVPGRAATLNPPPASDSRAR